VLTAPAAGPPGAEVETSGMKQVRDAPIHGEKRLVVVMEDDRAVRELLCELLVATGFQIKGCGSGSEGLRAVKEAQPSAVILDLHMPGMDGVEVLDLLAKDESTSSVPVVVVSSYASDRSLWSRGQVKEVLQKPFDVGTLCRRVMEVANGRSR